MNKGNRATIILLLFILSAGAAAPESKDPSPSVVPELPPQFTLSSTYQATAQDGRSVNDAWTTPQSLVVDMNGRWGQNLYLEGVFNANFDNSYMTADSLINQLYMIWDINDFTILTFGKQTLKWSTARVFGSMDKLQAIPNPLDTHTKITGVSGAKVDFLPTEWLSFSLLALPGTKLQDSRLAARTDILWMDSDLSFGAVRYTSPSITGVNLTNSTPITQSYNNRMAFYSDFSRFFNFFGIYDEIQVCNSRDRDWLAVNSVGGTSGYQDNGNPYWNFSGTLGVEIDFPAWLNGTIVWRNEYHYNGGAFDESEAQNVSTALSSYRNSQLSYFSQPNGLSVGTFRRHYLFSGLGGIPVVHNLYLGGFLLSGLDSGFLMNALTLDFTISKNLSLSLEYDHFGQYWNTDQASDLCFLPMRNRVCLWFNGSF